MTSKRDLERRLTDLEGVDHGELPEASIHIILSSENAGEHDPLPNQPGLMRCFGDLYREPDLPSGVFEGENDNEGDGRDIRTF